MTTTILAVVAATLFVPWAMALVLFWYRLWPADLAAGGGPGLIADPVDVGVVLGTTALLAMVVAGLTGTGRVVLALGFVTFVPGWALLGLVPLLKVVGGGPPMIDDGAAVVGHVPLVTGMTKVAVAVAVSLTLCTLTAQVLLWLRVWNPSALLGGLGGLSLAALAIPSVRTSTLPVVVAR